jgi:hypothetical protein
MAHCRLSGRTSLTDRTVLIACLDLVPLMVGQTWPRFGADAHHTRATRVTPTDRDVLGRHHAVSE